MCFIFSYGVILSFYSFPTRRSSDLFLFEAIVGNGKSAGLMWGGDCSMDLWSHEERDMHVMMAFSSTSKYLFRKTDRKSTRLNSSHRCISYAVFCLKKKKK